MNCYFNAIYSVGIDWLITLCVKSTFCMPLLRCVHRRADHFKIVKFLRVKLFTTIHKRKLRNILHVLALFFLNFKLSCNLKIFDVFSSLL